MKLRNLAMAALVALAAAGCSSKDYVTVKAGDSEVRSNYIVYKPSDKSGRNSNNKSDGYVEYKPGKRDKDGNKGNRGGGGTSGTSSQLSALSKRLGVNLTKSDNYKLYNEVSGWLGVRYKYGGTSKSGVDCSGFTGNVYKAVYSITLTRNSAGMLSNDCRKVGKSNLQEGDLVFFRTDGKSTSTPNHVGLYLKDNMFAHASCSNGVVVSSLSSDYYRKSFLTGGRVTIGSKHSLPGSVKRKALPEAEEGDLMVFEWEEDGNVESDPSDITGEPIFDEEEVAASDSVEVTQFAMPSNVLGE